MKALELDDFLHYRFLSAVRWAPDGSKAAFVVSQADGEGKAYESRLWLYENGGLRQLTDLGKESRFVWLDSERLLFPAVRSAAEKQRSEAHEEFSSWYVLDLRGGEALPFFTLPVAAGELRVLDEDHYALIAPVDKRRPELFAADEAEREAARKAREDERDYEVLDEIPYWFNGQGVVNGQRNTLFLYTRSTGSLLPLTQSPEECLGMVQLGEKLIYAVSRREARMPLLGFALRTADWKTGQQNPLADCAELSFAGLEAVGEELWLFASECRRFGLNENAWVWRIDPASGKRTLLRAEEYSLYNSVGSDCRLGEGRQAAAQDGALWHLTTREGDCLLYRLDPDGEDRPVLEKPGSIDCFDIHGHEALLIALYDMRLQELYRLDVSSGVLERISSFNEEALLDRYVAEPQPLTVESEGVSVSGWVLLPKDFDPDKRYPAVFDIHGGPKTVYGPVFYHEMQLWASLGYFVFFCNPTGSDGRDNAFADIRGRYGTIDYVNLMAFADAVLAAWPQIDPDRVCETGGSYGGFMTNWIIGHTDRFCCAASQRSISNWLSFWGTSDIGYFFAPDQNAGDLYLSPDKLWERSPLKYAAAVKTPTLFIHSDEDYRCPLEQGLQMFTALVDRGVEARFCLFHGENHELSRSGKPKHRLRRLQEITDWFAHYAKT